MRCIDSGLGRISFWYKWTIKNKKHNRLYYKEISVKRQNKVNEIMNMLNKKIKVWKDFYTEINPKNPSVKKWILKIIDTYPKEVDEIEYLIDTFISALHTRSKENKKFVVGLLRLKDTLVLLHSRKDPSIAEIEDDLYLANAILHPNNILRADIIKKDNKNNLVFGAYEYSRGLSKGHAQFWGVPEEDINWEFSGTITLNVELEGFNYQLQLSVEEYEISSLYDEGLISPTGKVRIGRNEGKIVKVYIHNKSLDYATFYELYITHKRNLHKFKRAFNNIVNKKDLFSYSSPYKYIEDEKTIYRINPNGKKYEILKKDHPIYTICFLTNKNVEIRPSQEFILKIYDSIFYYKDRKLEIWHAGESTSIIPFEIGSLKIYNKITFPKDINTFSNKLLSQIKDAQSKKVRYLLEYFFCKLYSENIKNKHIKYLFDFLVEEIIKKEINYEFNNGKGFLQKEDIIEFKSADDVSSKPTQFVKEKLIPDIKNYIKNNVLDRYLLIYGIEDNSTIKPLYHLKSDMITIIEDKTNEMLKKELENGSININVKILILPIPFKEGVVLVVFIIPISR